MTDQQILHLLRLLFDPSVGLHKIHWDATAKSQQVIAEYLDGVNVYHKIGLNSDGTWTTFE